MATSTCSTYVTKHSIKTAILKYINKESRKALIIFSSSSLCPFSLSFSLRLAIQTPVCLVHQAHHVQCSINSPWLLDSLYRVLISLPYQTSRIVTSIWPISFPFPPFSPIFSQTSFHLFSFQATNINFVMYRQDFNDRCYLFNI